MERQDYERLLILAERGDLTPEERLEFIEQTEELSDAPGGVRAALPHLIRAASLLRDEDSEAARSVREAIRLLREFDAGGDAA